MSDVLVSESPSGLVSQPSVESFFGSQYVALWADGSDASIKGLTVRSDGTVLGDPFRVDDPPTTPDGNTNRQWPVMEAAGFASFAAWIEQPFNIPPPSPRIVMRRFADGQPSGPNIPVSSAAIDTTQRPSVTRMIDGGCVVVWAGADQAARIRAQRFGIDGMPTGSEIPVNATPGEHRKSAVSVLSNGDFVVAWRAANGGRLTFRLFDLDGNPRTDEVQPNISGFEGVNAITLLDNGRFVLAHPVAIADSDLGVPQVTIVASIFEPDGNGTPVTSVTAGSPQGFLRTWPALTALPGGRFLLAWVEKSATTFETVPQVMAKLCSDAQLDLSGPVTVSAATDGIRFQVCAAAAFGEPTVAESVLIAWGDHPVVSENKTSVRARTFEVTSSGQLVQGLS